MAGSARSVAHVSRETFQSHVSRETSAKGGRPADYSAATPDSAIATSLSFS
jgi:hypothetical protein